MPVRVGYATAGDARGPLIFAEYKSKDVEVTVLPGGAGAAEIGGDYMSVSDFLRHQAAWGVEWFDDDRARATITAIKGYYRSFRWVRMRGYVADPTLFEAERKLVLAQIAEHGMWLIPPNVRWIEASLRSVVSDEPAPSAISRKEFKDISRAEAYLAPLLDKLAETGLTLALIDRNKVPKDLWNTTTGDHEE